ncbi:MAG: urea ABC transporter permease subunit UrtB [Geminicoccaceae bacterium]
MRPFLLLLTFLLAALPAAAQSPLDGFASGKFDDLEKAVQAVGASGVPTAEPLLRALADGKVKVRAADKAVFYEDASGALVDAATGQPATDADAAGLKAVKVNNRIRRAVEAALGGLTLGSADPAQRLVAATNLFAHPDPAAMPAIEQAIATEQDPAVKAAFERARAVLLLEAGSSTEQRAAAAALLAETPTDEIRGKLQVARNALPADADPVLVTAFDSAIASVDNHLRVVGVASSIFQGISLGSVLLLAAIGLAITFGVMGVINMAHGEMVMLGAYTTYVVQEFCRTSFPAGLPWSLPVAIPLAFLVAGAVGVVLERTVICRLYGRPLETLLATWGVSLILQQTVRTIFGPSNREVSTPSWMSGSVELWGGLQLTENRIAIILFAMVVFAVLMLVVRTTRLGLEMRAVTQNRRMAASMGIRTAWVDAMTFGLGSGIAGIAGVALSQIDNVSPNLGQGYIIDSFMVVVFGGVGNLWGTLTAALTLGIVNKFLEPLAGAVLAKILVLIALILFIQKRPRGLFPVRGRAVEA